MRTPLGLPARIRTDSTNAFAHHTQSVRVPAIVDEVRQHNPDYAAPILERLEQLADGMRRDAPLPRLDPGGPASEGWVQALAERQGQTWLGTDWFFAETYAYRLVCDAVGFWQSARDPFRPIKRAEYASREHAAALAAAAALDGAPADLLERLLGASLFGNRIDLSFAASRAHGTSIGGDDLLDDDRPAAARLLLEGTGPVHVVLDNAGTELSVDLVAVARFLEQRLSPVVLHLKLHPCFVSDATEADVRWFLTGEDAAARAVWEGSTDAARRCRATLNTALADGRLRLAPHPFWNSSGSLWDAAEPLERDLSGARLVILKGDANYRRALGDALWPADTPPREATAYFPAPLLLLRTLKSDPIVGLAPGQAQALDQVDPRWRVNGRRGVATLGGKLPLATRSGASP